MLMKTSFLVIATSLMVAAAHADTMQTAMALGSVIAGEKPCGLEYDQPAIQRYISKNVPESDMQFGGTLNLMVQGMEYQIRDMSTSARTAFCAQTGRAAHANGFVR